MIKQDKELILKDLCARLPYGVKVQNVINGSIYDLKEYLYCLPGALTTNFKPYLRPMSSMTDEEQEDFLNLVILYNGKAFIEEKNLPLVIKFYNSHHLDYNNLIPMGLALPAPEGMYKIF